MEEISDEELRSLTRAIKMRYDIDFTNYEPKSLKRGFARLISRNGMGSLLGLWSKVLQDREFFMGCIDDLTVNETGLFRNPEVWTTMKNLINDQFSNRNELSIWHAGCSSGEEVYTLAMVLEEIGMLRKTKAVASDLSTRILAKAKKGEFSELLLNKYEKSYVEYSPNGNLKKYFNKDGDDSYLINPRLRSHVEFIQHNLVSEGMNKTFDIIFCRNVMIYFDSSLKTNVLDLFHKSLAPGGYFIIGYYDSLPIESRDLFEVYDPTHRIYRKK